MRYALGIEYDGRPFNGWQSQLDDPSVQDVIEQSISVVADHPVTVVCAGRTDTGVHALCQVAHFDSPALRTERQWVLGINSNLPPAVCVRWVRQVNDDFHARFSAFERSYRYTILNRWVRPALQVGKVSWCRKPLDADLMHEAARVLLGEHDFSAFRSAGCKARHAVRTVNDVSVTRDKEFVVINISANGFLYHMVRNIAGSLIEIGAGKRPVGWLNEVLLAGDRTLAGITAPPDGLYFSGVRYPDQHQLPETLAAFPETGDSDG